MGNEQSALSPREHNKLTKPRTNRHAPANSFRASQLRDSRSIISDYDESKLSISRSDTNDSKHMRELRKQLQSELFGSRELLRTSDDQYEDESSTSRRSRASRVSRANSLATEQPSSHASTIKLQHTGVASQLSLLSESSPVDKKTAVAMLQRFSKNASPDELAALQTAIVASQPHDVSPIEDSDPPEDATDQDTSALIRRRSFAPPGLATRHDRTVERPVINPLGAHPVREHDLDLGVLLREEHLEEHVEEPLDEPPTLDRLMVMNLSPSGRDSPYSRAQTPGDMDYPHIGTLKIGSLVVTNGAVSPEPSIRTARAMTPTQSFLDLRDDDYYTASEGQSSGTVTPATTYEVRNGKLRIARSVEDIPPLPNSVHNSASMFNLQAPTRIPARRPSSPLKQEATWSEPNGDHMVHDMKLAQPQLQVQAQVLTRSASHFARGYLSELPSSPYNARPNLSLNMSRSVSQESTSQYSQATDEGFAEPNMDEAFDESFVSDPQSIYSEYGQLEASPVSYTDEDAMKTPVKLTRPRQTKADSGYSSSTSTRGLPTPPDEKDVSPLSYEEQVDDRPTRRSTVSRRDQSDVESLYTFDQMLKELPPVAASYLDSPKVAQPAVKPVRMSLLRSVSWGRKSRMSFSPMASTDTIPTIASTLTSKSKPESKQSKKLQKAKPKSKVPVQVQALRAVESVPRIPTPIRRKHSNRLLNNPGMDHLERTYGSTADEDMEDGESEFGEPFEIRFPSPAPEVDLEEALAKNKKKHRSRRFSKAAKTVQSEPSSRPPTPPEHRSGMASFFRRGSRGPSMDRPRPSFEETAAMIADFGTAAQSLGSSPYDVATEMTRSNSRSSAAAAREAVYHPHQISTNVIRRRSWVEMDDETAAEFARRRSRERAAIAEAREAATYDFALQSRRIAIPPKRPSMGPRPHSFYDNIPGSRVSSGGSVYSLGRARSFDEDRRPIYPVRVPSGGSDRSRGRPKSFQEWELQRRNSGPSRSKSRPRGKLVDATPPVPPLPAQTLERDEEHFFSPTPPQPRTNTDGVKNLLVKPQSGHLRSKSDTAPEVVVTPDWTASGDIWRQRRMQLSQNLQLHTNKGSVQPLPSMKGNQGFEQDEAISPIEPIEEMKPPAIVVSRYMTPSPTQGLTELDAMESERPVERYELAAFPTPPRPPKHSTPVSARPRSASPAPSTVLEQSMDPVSMTPPRRMTPFDRAAAKGTSSPTKGSLLGPNRTSVAMYDRYSGGLAYEYEPGKGVGGSAGTRAIKGATTRRSGPLSQGYGVDLSDVPVFFPQRVG
ncbi:hypothetical protein NA57DRAFT_76433 [Rhizodiscina lignyota]|uniref:Uncharacterized protein n=1 Tax=Rhizodiscina lignyota TaxID=1504668 RepID=A0A9P4MAZ2_9PEZI|nr:hypothetical protein NA57DRAFT_76433 [Rhizodiscina lignyota]